MRQFDRPARLAAQGIARFGDPATWVCAALALAVVVLSVRIVSIW
ncbi:MAG: hypothetical protein JWR73_2503 [Tardiphaga sp.]|jgi:hypothetical protein|nr:hypothetical protein [Tardiphaga sp.]MDB5548501.1 hypothetical protein [Tardiphaga sp.]MDB5626701.1 hypothetical protein [Tardiphaga sp.]